MSTNSEGITVFSATVRDRLIVPEFFPERANLLSKIIEQDIAQKVRFSQEEITEFEIKQNPNGAVSWNPEKAKEKEIGLTKSEVQFLKEQVARIDAEKAFTSATVETAQKIKAL
jgi:hypothetical protein